MAENDVSKTLELDGVADVVALGPAYLIGLGADDFTVEAWVRLEAGGTDYLPVLGTDEAAQNLGLHLAVKDRKPYLGFYENDTAGQTELAPGVWYHLAWRFTADGGEQAIFLNGVLDASAAGKSPYAGQAETVYAGRYAVDQHYKGRLAELRVWRAARSAEQILSGMHRRLHGDEPHLAAYWPLDEEAGELAPNRKAALPAVSHGAATQLFAAPPDARLAPIRRHGGEEGYPFRGIRLVASGRNGHWSGNRTYEFWFRCTGGARHLFSVRGNYNTSYRSYIHVSIHDDGRLHIHAARHYGSSSRNDSNDRYEDCGDLLDGRWHHFALASESNGYYHRVYVDGVYKRQFYMNCGYNHYNNFDSIQFGDWIEEAQPECFIAEFRVWSQYRSKSTIQNNMYQRLSRGTSYLEYYYPFYGGGGQTMPLYEDTAAHLERFPWTEPEVPVPLLPPPRVRLDGDQDAIAVPARAMNFDGSNDYVDLGAGVLLGGEYTQELWIYPTATDNNYRAILGGATGSSGGVRPPYLYLKDQTKLHPGFGYGSGQWGKLTGSILAVNAWNHVAVTYDGTDYKIYVDGEERFSEAVPEDRKPADNPVKYICRADNYFKGRVADVRFWNHARTQDQVRENRSRRLAGQEEGLVGYWPLDVVEHGKARDLSASGYHGTPQNGASVIEVFDRPAMDPTYTYEAWLRPEGRLFHKPRVMTFDGANDYVEVPYSSELSCEEFTVSLYAKVTSNPTYWRNCFDHHQSSGGICLFAGHYHHNHWRFAIHDGAGSKDLYGPTVAFHEWIHIAITFNGDTAALYVNGQLEESLANIKFQPSTNQAIRIGAGGQDSSPINHFPGQLAEVKFRDRALSQSEIRRDMSRKPEAGESGLVAYWPLDDVALGKAIDASGNGHDGECKGAIGLKEDETLPVVREAAGGGDASLERRASLFGPLPRVTHFDGSGDYITAPYASELSCKDFTVSLLARITSSGDSCPLCSRSGSPGWMFRATSSNVWQIYVYSGNSWVSIDGPGITFKVWTHLAATLDGQTLSFYVNGVLAGTAAVADYKPNLSGPLYIGAERSTGSPYHDFPGQIAEVRFWNGAQDEAEIRRGMHSRLRGDEEGLVGYWPLDDLVDGKAKDLGPLQLDGTLHGHTKLISDATLPVLDQDLLLLAQDGTLRHRYPTGEGTAEGPPAGRIPRVMSFDGSGDCVAVPYESVLGCKQYTVSFYARVTGGSGIRACFCSRTSNGTGPLFLVGNDNRWRLHVKDSFGSWHELKGSSVVNNVWAYLTATYDGDAVSLYVDGVLLDSESNYNLPINKNGPLCIGGRVQGEADPDSLFRGQIAEVRLRNLALDEAQIRQDMQRRLSGDEEGLVGYWPLDDLVDGKAKDLGPNQLDGTLYGQPQLVSDATLLRDHYQTAVPWNAWSHVAITNDGTTARTFVDGEVAGEGPVEALAGISGGLRFGAGFRGALAEMRTWNVARTPEEVAAAKDRRLTGDEAGLVGYWPLDESSGDDVYNVASEALHGTLLGGERSSAWLEPFADAEVLDLDGTEAYLEIPHTPEIDFAQPSQSFSVEVWARAAADQASPGDDEHVIVEKWSGIGSFPYSLRYRHRSGRFVFSRSTGAPPVPEVVSTSLFADGAFHHLAAVKDGSTLRLYVDGEAQGTATDPIDTTIRGEAPLYVGSRAGESCFLTGSLAELRLWNRALSPTEISDGKWLRLQGDEAGLAGYWPLDGLAGEEAEAAGALTRPAGQLTSGTWVADERLPLLGHAEAPLTTAPAACFDGYQSAVSVAFDPDEPAALMPEATLTVEAWVKPAATGGEAFEGPVAAAADAVGGWELRATDREYGFLVTVDGAQQQVRCVAAAGSGWAHLAGVYDGERLRLYVNGVPMPTAVQTVPGQITPYSGDFKIGAHPYWPRRHFNGQISEVRVWSTARTAAQIHEHLHRRLNGEEPGLSGYWPLDDGSGDRVIRRGGAASSGDAVEVQWTESDLPPRVEPAETPDPYSQDRLEVLQRRLDGLVKELEAENARITTLDLQRFELKRQVNTKEEALEGLRAEHAAPYQAEIAELDERIAAIEAERAEIEDSGVDAFLESVIRDTHTQIEDARKDLATKGSGYGLDGVTMELRYVAGAGGRGAIFPPIDTVVEPEKISTLELDFEPVRPPAVETPPNTVPEVTGLTATVARRKLAAAGFVAELHSQAVRDAAGQPSRVGRVVSQMPPPASDSQPGSTVRLFLGKAS